MKCSEISINAEVVEQAVNRHKAKSGKGEPRETR